MDIEDIVRRIGGNINSSTEGSALAKLFRTIVMQLGYNHIKFNKALDEYVARYNSRARYSKHIKAISKGHIARKLTSDELTWKTFLMALFHFLNAKEVEVIVRIKHQNNSITSHSVLIANNDLPTNLDGEENERL